MGVVLPGLQLRRASLPVNELHLIRGEEPGAPLFARGTQPPDNIDVEHRLTALETRLDTVLPTLATKSDLAQMESRLLRWFVGTAIAIVTLLFSGTAWMLSHVGPIAASQPIVIQVPAAPAAK